MSHHLLVITAPCAWVRSNDHTHWRNRHTLTATWRAVAALQARRLPVFGAGPVHVTATIHRDDNRRYDLDGVTPTVKACIDGLRDAGRLSEDHCGVIPQLTIRHGEQWADAALVLVIEEAFHGAA